MLSQLCGVVVLLFAVTTRPSLQLHLLESDSVKQYKSVDFMIFSIGTQLLSLRWKTFRLTCGTFIKDALPNFIRIDRVLYKPQ